MTRGSKPLRRALYFLHRSGCRPCEMREAEYEDILWDKSVVALYRHKTARTTGQARLIPLDAGTLRFLRNLRKRHPEGQEKIFLNSHGTVWDRHAFARHLRRTAKRIGLDDGVEERVSACCVRHLFTGEMVDLGFSDRQIADALGHADTRLVSWYSHNRHKIESLRRTAQEMRRRKRERRE